MQRGEVRNSVTVLLLVMFTCGIYAIYWMVQVMEEINKGLGREEFTPVKEILLSVVTCGAWGIYVQWRIAEAVVELQQKWGVEPKMDAPIVFATGLAGLSPFFIQESLNNAWENGSPGGGGGGGGYGQQGGGF
jgi:hypothetical protein